MYPSRKNNLSMIISSDNDINDNVFLQKKYLKYKKNIITIDEVLKSMIKEVEKKYKTKVIYADVLFYSTLNKNYYKGYKNDYDYGFGSFESFKGFIFVTKKKLKKMKLENEVNVISETIDKELNNISKKYYLKLAQKQ